MSDKIDESVFLNEIFNAETNVPSTKKILVEDGDYIVKIIDGEYKESNAGHLYLLLYFEIHDKNYPKIKLIENFNIAHPNDKVRSIAVTSIKKILKANHITETTSDKFKLINLLKDKYVKCHIAKVHDDYKESEVNRIKYFYDNNASQSKLDPVGHKFYEEVMKEKVEVDEEIPF